VRAFFASVMACQLVLRNRSKPALQLHLMHRGMWHTMGRSLDHGPCLQADLFALGHRLTQELPSSALGWYTVRGCEQLDRRRLCSASTGAA
jgi:hypothetical protein